MKQYIQPVKKQFRNISFLVLSAVLLALATALTFDGWSHDLDQPASKTQVYTLEEETSPTVLDTTKFFIDNTCYEYTQFEEVTDQLQKSDQLSKTVVKVETNEGQYEEIESSSIKMLPPNASVNLMIEKYTVKRKFDNAIPSFFVTVESFNTTIERNNLFDFEIKDDEIGTSLNNQQLELIKKFCEDDKIAKERLQTDRPI